MNTKYKKLLITITASIAIATLVSTASTTSATSATSAIKFPADGKTIAIIKLDAYHNGQKIGSTNIPEGREVKVATETSTHYRVELNESTHGWVKKEDIEVLKGSPMPPMTPAEPKEPKEPTSLTKTPEQNSSEPHGGLDEEASKVHSTEENSAQGSLEIMNPGNIVFLAIPFNKQDRKGICAGSSFLNIVDYLGQSHRHGQNRFDLTQEEFFSLLNAGKKGATIKDIQHGLGQINYVISSLYLKGGKSLKEEEKKELVDQLMAELDKNAPLSILGSGHASVLVGYNSPRKVFYVWDQNKTTNCNNVKKVIPSAPAGIYEVPMSSITNKVDAIIKVFRSSPYIKRGGSYEPAQIHSEARYIEKLAKKKIWTQMLPHKFHQPENLSDSEYLELGHKQLPLLMTGLMKNNWKVAIPSLPYDPDLTSVNNADNSIVIIQSLKDGIFYGIKYPEANEISFSPSELSGLILANKGKGEARYWTFD